MEDDASLVKQTVAGDTSAFGQLYDRYARVIRAICFDETREIHAAQELAQEVFLRAFARLAKLRIAERFGPWLVSIARNVCREWRRGRRRDRHRYMGTPPCGLPITSRWTGKKSSRILMIGSKQTFLHDRTCSRFRCRKVTR